MSALVNGNKEDEVVEVDREGRRRRLQGIFDDEDVGKKKGDDESRDDFLLIVGG